MHRNILTDVGLGVIPDLDAPIEEVRFAAEYGSRLKAGTTMFHFAA